jgi:hypothetical protein
MWLWWKITGGQTHGAGTHAYVETSLAGAGKPRPY